MLTNMNKVNLPKLSLGTSDFSALRGARQIYVDKTDLIFELASERQKFFLARPRRFGKSLLISTFDSLFRNGLLDFRGLAIERLWEEEKPCAVVKLDFSEIKDFSNFSYFEERLRGFVPDAFEAAGFIFDPCSYKPLWTQLSAWLRTLPVNSLVLLIDEYDAPLTTSLDDPELFRKVRLALAEFYSVIKANDRVFRFFFMTGITKFNKTSIFSELNNLTDISLDPHFGTLLGYTKNEVENVFSAHLVRAGDALGLGREELLYELTRHYDGFCFDRFAETHVFAPWSLLNFLSTPKNGFLNYWIESGGRPSVLTQYLKSHTLKSPENFSQQKTIALSVLSNSSDVETLSDVGLLTQAGYLTIKSVEDDTAFLDYPNIEVRTAMAQLYMEKILSGKTAVEAGVGNIGRRLATEPPADIVGLLNRLFASIDFNRYPVRDEASVRAFVQTYFAGAGLSPRVEVHGNFGRSDLEVEAGGRCWVFEFKVKRRSDSEERLLREALEQISTKEYGKALETRELIRLALVFSFEERAFVRWAAAV